jgi:RNA polymerase sigma-70 factor (ECF subfamily)
MKLFSLGGACQVKYHIDKHVKNEKTNFFDWLITNFKSVLYILENIDNLIRITETENIHIELEQKEACQKIFEAINQLSDNQKTALILLKIEDKSQAETAEIMNLKVKALESLFQRAKNNLEILLNKKG